MRRSTRHISSGSSGGGPAGVQHPAPFYNCVAATNRYFGVAGVELFVLFNDFLRTKKAWSGLQYRIRRNKSFVYTAINSQPPKYPSNMPPYLQTVPLDNIVEREEVLLQQLQDESCPLMLVMVVDPGADEQAHSRPLAGVLVRIGNTTSKGDERPPRQSPGSSSQYATCFSTSAGASSGGAGGVGHGGRASTPSNEQLERSIVFSFVRRNADPRTARELLRITLLRAVTEALCFEEVWQRVYQARCAVQVRSGPGALATVGDGAHALPASELAVNSASAIARERRFVSINTNELALCPEELLPVLNEDLRFMKHWDDETGMTKSKHDDHQRECCCIRKTRPPNCASEADAVRGDDLYQFFTLTFRRVKGLLEQKLDSLVGEAPQPGLSSLMRLYVRRRDKSAAQMDESGAQGKLKDRRETGEEVTAGKGTGTGVEQSNVCTVERSSEAFVLAADSTESNSFTCCATKRQRVSDSCAARSGDDEKGASSSNAVDDSHNYHPEVGRPELSRTRRNKSTLLSADHGNSSSSSPSGSDSTPSYTGKSSNNNNTNQRPPSHDSNRYCSLEQAVMNTTRPAVSNTALSQGIDASMEPPVFAGVSPAVGQSNAAESDSSSATTATPESIAQASSSAEDPDEYTQRGPTWFGGTTVTSAAADAPGYLATAVTGTRKRRRRDLLNGTVGEALSSFQDSESVDAGWVQQSTRGYRRLEYGEAGGVGGNFGEVSFPGNNSGQLLGAGGEKLQIPKPYTDNCSDATGKIYFSNCNVISKDPAISAIHQVSGRTTYPSHGAAAPDSVNAATFSSNPILSESDLCRRTIEKRPDGQSPTV